jgi:hypothetical protein
MERDRTNILALGRRLADSVGFRVIALDGREVGLLEHVRYRDHTDHPDEIVVRRRRFLRDRQTVLAFDQIANIDRRSESVYLAVPTSAIEWRSGTD